MSERTKTKEQRELKEVNEEWYGAFRFVLFRSLISFVSFNSLSYCNLQEGRKELNEGNNMRGKNGTRMGVETET